MVVVDSAFDILDLFPIRGKRIILSNGPWCLLLFFRTSFWFLFTLGVRGSLLLHARCGVLVLRILCGRSRFRLLDRWHGCFFMLFVL